MIQVALLCQMKEIKQNIIDSRLRLDFINALKPILFKWATRDG